MKPISRIALLVLATLLTATAGAQSYTPLYFKAAGSPVTPKVPMSWNRYLTNAGLEKVCRDLAAAYPDLVKLQSIGKSYGGIDIWVMTVTDFKKGTPESKPAFWVDGNIHGNEIQCAEASLYTAWYLAESFNDSPFIRELLAHKTFYVAPTLNPDGRAAFTEEAGSLRSGIVPLDTDRDGTADEDGPEDLNGDGFITQMRRRSPNGRYIDDPEFPGRMVPAAPDQPGQWELLGMEGTDNDGDGRVNEDGPGGYDPNRDAGFDWQPNFIQRGAMGYPFSLPETRAVADFIMAHPNIAGVQSFHNSGGWLMRSPGSEILTNQIPSQDMALYDLLGKKGEEIIPNYGYISIYKPEVGGPSLYGGFIDWVYFGRGVVNFSNELWSRAEIFQSAYKGEYDTRQYAFDKWLLFGDTHADWQAYDHPQYGPIEIGGFKKTSTTSLHSGFLLEQGTHRNAAFVIYHADQMPLLSISRVTEKELGGGLRQVTAEVTNLRPIPTHTARDLQHRISPPDRISIEGPEVISGVVLDNPDLNSGNEQRYEPRRLAVENIPGNETVAVRWIVRGNATPRITVESARGGTIRQ